MTQRITMPKDLEARRAQMFPVLSGGELARVGAFGVETTFEDGEIVFEQGDRDVPFYVVLEGELEIVHPRGKLEEPITVHGAREFAGEVSLLADRPALVRGRARGRLRVIRVERARLRSLIQTDPDLSEVLMRAFILRRVGLLRAGQGDVVVIGSRDSAATLRLQEFLVRNGHPYGYVDVDRDPDVQTLLDEFHVDTADIPILICGDKRALRNPTDAEMLGSDSENLKKWEDQIRRDRNHPSVAIWSVANEEFNTQATPQGGNVARTMQNFVKSLDPTRPVTYAAPQGDTFDGINGVIEVRGWNYHVGKSADQYGKDMDGYHAKHPGQPNVGTEQGSTVSTRGIYENDKQRGYVSAYDANAPSWANLAEEWMTVFAARPWMSGGFVWTGFDYRGEPTPYAWPCINSHFGILDTCGFPKDLFYYYQSWWTTNTVLHLLPHWNWPGKGEIRVDAFSNCKSVELFLNGTSLGKQEMKPYSHLTWPVKYAPGTLSAKGFDADGKVIAETKVETTGTATQIQLTPDRKTINADGKDVSVFTVSALDAQGRAVPVAQNKINFAIEGAGKILGVGNGDPSCHEPDTFIPQMPMRTVAVSDWRWKLAEVPPKGASAPEYANIFDDSTWNTIKPKTDGDTGDMVLKEGETAIYRAHVRLTEADLKNPGIQIRFGTIDDRGWIFVNNTRVGESHDWKAQPAFDIKKALHAGDNVIAVGVKNDAGEGGMDPDVNLEITGKPVALAWSRSLFNGLAQILVQSTRDAGEIKLTASADDLKSATASVQTQPGTPRPSVP